MTIYTFSAPPSNSTTTNFRLWGKGISDALTAVGVVKTADTGQIDWTTVAAPATANTVMGYEIRTLTDNVGMPVYIKITYGSGSATGTPSLPITIGTGTDGAGNLTGNITPSAAFSPGSNSTSNMNCFASSDGSTYMTLGLWMDTAGGLFPQGISVARTRDNFGNATATGVQLLAAYLDGSSNGNRHQSFIPKLGTGSTYTYLNNNVSVSFHCAAPSGGTGNVGGNLGVFPVYCSRGIADNHCLDMCVGFNADFNSPLGAGSTVTVPMYGVNRTYCYIGPTGTSVSVNSNANTHSVLLRYE